MTGQVTTVDLKGFLNKNIEVLRSVAAKIITPERMVRLVCVAATRDPKLAECTPMSILRAMTSAAECGLEVCSGANEGYLVPYNVKVKRNGREDWEKQAQFIPGYQGMVKKAIESGKVNNIESRVVYAKDSFDYELGDCPSVKHKPHLGADRGEILAVYAIAFMPNGSKQFEVMAKDEIDAIMNRGKEKSNSPWKTDYAEMARKTVVRRLYKYIPKSKAMADLLEIQAKAEAGTFDIEPDPERPGDAPETISETSGKTLNEDGDLEIVWTDEERESAKAECQDMTEKLMESGMEQKEAEEIMVDRWNTIGLPDLSYNTWANRFYGFREKHLKTK
jgi:phage RecT family recombinase